MMLAKICTREENKWCNKCVNDRKQTASKEINKQLCFGVLSSSVMSDSLPPHGLQHARLPCPLPSPRVCSNPCPLRWCHLTISSSPLSPPAFYLSQHQAFHIRWPKYWSFSFSISPSNEYSGLISLRIDCFHLLAVQGTLKNLLQTTVGEHQSFGTQLSLLPNSPIHTWLLKKP